MNGYDREYFKEVFDGVKQLPLTEALESLKRFFLEDVRMSGENFSSYIEEPYKTDRNQDPISLLKMYEMLEVCELEIQVYSMYVD